MNGVVVGGEQAPSIVVAIEESEDNGKARRRIVAIPVTFFW